MSSDVLKVVSDSCQERLRHVISETVVAAEHRLEIYRVRLCGRLLVIAKYYHLNMMRIRVNCLDLQWWFLAQFYDVICAGSLHKILVIWISWIFKVRVPAKNRIY